MFSFDSKIPMEKLIGSTVLSIEFFQNGFNLNLDRGDRINIYYYSWFYENNIQANESHYYIISLINKTINRIEHIDKMNLIITFDDENVKFMDSIDEMELFSFKICNEIYVV